MNINTDLFIDYVIACVFFVIGVYAYWEARTFGGGTDLWPKMLSVVIVFLCLLLVVRKYVPDIINEFMTDSSEVVQMEENIKQEDTNDETDPEDVDRIVDDATFTVLSTVGYIGLSYLFGILWISPLFVAGYMSWFKIRSAVIAVMSAVSFVIAYAFMKVLFLPLDEGLLFNGIGI
jgi:hypothetical protein